MPKTMQQIMVRIRPMISTSPEAMTMTLMSVEARPVMVMQPAIMPAIAQATATEMEFFAPAAKASQQVHSAVLVDSKSTLAKLWPSARLSQLVWMKWM